MHDTDSEHFLIRIFAHIYDSSDNYFPFEPLVCDEERIEYPKYSSQS
jgi:hypothetical protein